MGSTNQTSRVPFTLLILLIFAVSSNRAFTTIPPNTISPYCNEVFTEAPGSIESPNYPGNYPNGASCSYHIIADAYHFVIFVTQDFLLESCCDYMTIYDSSWADITKRIGRYNGNDQPPPISSSGRDLFITFTSDFSITYRGFSAVFEFSPLYGNTSYCNNTFAETSGITGIIASENYPNNYPDNSLCYYRIDGEEDSVVMLTIQDFFLDQCFHDTLVVYDGPEADDTKMIGIFCGSDAPLSITSTSSSMYLIFTSDESVNAKGFSAIFSFVQVFKCDSTIIDAPGNFTSPNYPNPYPPDVICRTLITAPEGMQVLLLIQEFYLQSDNGCDDTDSLSIYDSDEASEQAMIGRYCGRTIPQSFSSSGQSLFLVFVSDSYTEYRGFEITYNFVPDRGLECGVQTAPLYPETNIVDGQPAQKGEWPWQAAQLYEWGDFAGCSASLLTSSWIVTAAHCIHSIKDVGSYLYLMGVTDLLYEPNGSEQLAEISRIYVHPNYTKSDYEYDSDIALLRLTNPITINHYARAVCPTAADMDKIFIPGTEAVVSGWGSTYEGGSYNYDLQEANVFIVEPDVCRDVYDHETINDNMICAGFRNESERICEWDDGGPLVAKFNDTWYLLGVVSFGNGCANNKFPDVYTSVSAFEEWIAPIFNGDEPEAFVCDYNEFTCADGWCVGYAKKCDDQYDCEDYGSDESFCGDYVKYFDQFPGEKLMDQSIVERKPAQHPNDCAYICLNTTEYVCLAFDAVTSDNGSLICALGTTGYLTEGYAGFDRLNFQIEKMPLPGSLIATRSSRRIATPKWLKADGAEAATDNFFWVVAPSTTGVNIHSINVTFAVIHHGDPVPVCIDKLVIRSGSQEDSPETSAYCFHEIPESVSVESESIRLEVQMSNQFEQGFLAETIPEWDCNGEFDDAPGEVMTPEYPQNYPNNIRCRSLITAPVGSQVQLQISDFQLEYEEFCQSDLLSIYDADTLNEDKLLGVFCGNMIPSVFQSTERSLLVVFESDISITYRGFHASYEFVTKSLNETVCGNQSAPLDPEPEVIGGKPAQVGEWPWQAAHILDGYYINCGGSLLSPEWIVTAASCVYYLTHPWINTYLVGVNDLSNVFSGHQQYSEVEEIFVHPNYSNVYPNFDWNIALMKLATPFVITDYVHPVCSPGADMDRLFSDGTKCTFTGWGVTENGGSYSNDLLEADLSIEDQDTCENRYEPNPITDNMICAGVRGEAKGPCSGDGGGPLVSKLNDTWYLVGTASFGYGGCAGDTYPMVFTRVTAFEQWISPIYQGENPEGYRCGYDDFQCFDGWCTDYTVKCNGNYDGCNDGSDEYYCGGYLEFFDPFDGIMLSPTSVKNSFAVETEEQCSYICLNTTEYACVTFDLQYGDRNLTCHLADAAFETIPTDYKTLNFQIAKMPKPGSTIQTTSGRLASPRWQPYWSDIEPPFFWVIQQENSDVNVMISIHFIIIHHGPPEECENGTDLVFRMGPDLSSPLYDHFCLHEVPEKVAVPSSVLRLEFNVLDFYEYGFVAEFTQDWNCDIKISEPQSGTISSPNYPRNYPDYANCRTLISAPSGFSVLLTILDFDLYYTDSGCTSDALKIYDATFADEEELIGAFCGLIPAFFISSNTSLFIVFESDASLSGSGFQARYEFVKDLEFGNDTCGIQTLDLEPEQKIIGGKPAQEGEWPWQAAHLENVGSGNYYQCGASVLTPEWIVTSASCISYISQPWINVYFMGAYDLGNVVNGHQQLSEASKVYIHPNYTSDLFDWDIALVRLDKPLYVTDHVRTVCVPSAEMDNLDVIGTVTTATGWGETSEGIFSPVLQETELLIVDQATCRDQYYPAPITDNMLCAGVPEGGKGPCYGDGGGPLVSQFNETWFLLGIVSWGRVCEQQNSPAVFTRVSSFSDWIQPIFDGEEPIGYECDYDEYLCLDGWCTNYEFKCNSYYDGCNDGSEEDFCYRTLKFFDPFENTQLTPSSIFDTFSVYDEEDCAYLCLDSRNVTCVAFDFHDDKCDLAGRGYENRQSGDYSGLHFKIEKMPPPGSTIDDFTARIAAPKWLPSLPGGDHFFWIIKPNSTDVSNTMFTFEISTIHHGGSSANCSHEDTLNKIVVRSGTDASSPIYLDYCLHDVPGTLYIPGPAFRLEFHTFNSSQFGFVGDLTTEIICDRDIYYEPPSGTFTSPNYPNDYSNDEECHTLLYAPPDLVVRLSILDFSLEYDSYCEYDSLSVYDAAYADRNRLIGIYCGRSIPDVFLSTGNSLYLVFLTDGSVVDRGFQALYEFVEGPICDSEITDPPNGLISSPNYPYSYPENAHCFTMLTAPPDFIVKLTVLDFDVEYDYTCSGDSLTIYDGDRPDETFLIGKYCGNLIPSMMWSTNQSLYLLFVSDNYQYYYDIGYQARYEFTDDLGLSNDTTCGKQTVDLEPEVKIIGGKPAQDGEWPWQAAQLDSFYDFGHEIRCGGTLLTDDWILTAASCIPEINNPWENIYVVGFNDETNIDNGHQQFSEAAGIYVHPNFTYDGESFELSDWDVALVRLSTSFITTDYVRRICIPDDDMQTFFGPGTTCTATGWGGGTNYSYGSEELREVNIQVMHLDDCPYSENMICAGIPGEQKGTCGRDFGGPLVSQVNDTWYLLGVAWEGVCDSRNDFGVYNSITALADWIKPIFLGEYPEAYSCAYNEYQCCDGWCYDYTHKCDGDYDGCSSDEGYCDGYLVFFDPLYNLNLMNSSIADRVRVLDPDDCALVCLEWQHGCLAYKTFYNDDGSWTCALASYGYEYEMAQNGFHFQIEKMPLPGTTITKRAGNIATPKWIAAFHPEPNSNDDFFWIVRGSFGNDLYLFSMEFVVIHHANEPSDCVDGNNTNKLILRNGADETSPVAYQYCLHELPNTIEMNASAIRIEYRTFAANLYGFVARYRTVQNCNGTYTEAPGTIVSPDYPNNYPDSSKCRSLIIAPVGKQVQLNILDFQLEEGIDWDDYSFSSQYSYSFSYGVDFWNCPFDYLAIYDGEYEDDNNLIGFYCGTYIPSIFQSSNRSLLLVFKSDSSITEKGFQADFHFFTDFANDSDCGIQTVQLAPESSIIGGKPAQEGEWPWQAAHIISEDFFNCGASLLTPEWVVTAASCIWSLTDPLINTYVMGFNNIQDIFDGNQQYAEVSDIFVHPNYSQFELDWDIALLRLDRPLIITDHVRTICIPDFNMDSLFDAGTNCTITGWGDTEQGYNRFLQEVEIPIMDQETCRSQHFPQPITDNMICAGLQDDSNKGVCYTDGGGPMVSNVNGTWYLVGVVSWGFGCYVEDYSIPVVNTKVTAFADWISPIFEDELPEGYQCVYEEYRCLDGWCVDYGLKCNSIFDGCYDGSDEFYCSAYLKFFDPFEGFQLTPSSVEMWFDGVDLQYCAYMCLNMEQFVCLAFDSIYDSGDWLCGLAGPNYETEIAADRSTLNFQFEKFPAPGIIMESAFGRFASPKWIRSYEPIGTSSFWIIQPLLLSNLTITVRFPAVHHYNSSIECTTADNVNEVTIRMGAQSDSPIYEQYCLNEVPYQIEIPNSVIRVEFTSFDVSKYGFVAEYKTEQSCEQIFTVAPGVFTSPNYPRNYPNDVNCRTLITAPEHMQVIMVMEDFELENGGPNCRNNYDTFSVYDSYNTDNSSLIGIYCGTDIPDSFISSGRSLNVVFKSDGSVTERGFQAGFYFVAGSSTSTEHTTSSFPNKTITPVEATSKVVHTSEIITSQPDMTTRTDTPTEPKTTIGTDIPTEVSSSPTYISSRKTITPVMTTEADGTSAPPTRDLTDPPVETTTRKPTTSIMSTVREEPPVSGPLPPPEYPEAGEDDQKIVAIEIKVLLIPEGCDPSVNSTSTPCEEFIDEFILQVSISYSSIDGFVGIVVTALRSSADNIGILAGNAIVQHEVLYKWNDMEPSNRGLTADEIYDMTVADDIENGNIGDLVVASCPECNAPTDMTPALCEPGDTNGMTCEQEYLEAFCMEGVPICQSPCLNSDKLYCNKHGICSQASGATPPQCSCLQGSDILFFGSNCQFAIEKVWLYVAVSVGGFLIIVVVVVLSLCLASSRREIKALKADPSDDSEQFGDDNEGYDTVDRGPKNDTTEPHQQPFSRIVYADGKKVQVRTFSRHRNKEDARMQAAKQNSYEETEMQPMAN